MSRFTRALLLVVACFGVVCTAGPSQTFHLNRIQAVAQQLQQAIQEQAHQIHDYSPLAKLREALRAINQQHANNQRFQAQAAECDSAVSSLNEVAASCSVSDIYEGLSDPNSLCPAAIRLFCRGDCSSRLNASLHQVNKNCSGLSDLQGDFNATSDFRQALVVANVFCQRDEEGRYCTNFFRNVSRLSTSLASGSLSADQLDRMCNSTCIADQFVQLTGFGQGSVLGTMGWARLLCSKIDDKYCALTYQENLLKLQAAKIAEEVQPQPPSNSSSNTTQPQPVQNSTDDNSNPRQIDYSQTNLNSTILDSACDVCFRRFVQGAHQLLTLTPNSTGTANFSAADFESSVDALSYVCNCEANRYCLNRLEANMTLIDLTACGDKFDNVNSSISGSCSNNCTDAIKSAIDAFGCCMLTYFQNKTQDSIVKGRNLGFPFIVEFIEDECDVPMPNSCAKRQVNFSVALSNVKASWINEKDNWEAVQEAFHWDLAARTGMPYDAIVVSSYDIKDFNENDPSTSGTSRIAHINHKKKKDKCSNHTDTPTPTKPPTTPTEPGQGVNVTNDTSSSNSTALIPDGIVINGAVYPPCDKDLAAFLDVQDNGFPDDDLDLVNTASAIPLDARVDALKPFKFMPEDSSVQLVNNPDGPK